jgi:hypothetical protein
MTSRWARSEFGGQEQCFLFVPRHATSFDMARLARIVVPETPHHVTALDNRREPIFFETATGKSISISSADEGARGAVDLLPDARPFHILCLAAGEGLALAVRAALPHESRPRADRRASSSMNESVNITAVTVFIASVMGDS